MNIIKEIPKFELGNQIEIAGMVLQGNGHTLALLFDSADEVQPEVVKLTHDKWKEVLQQLDTLEVEILDPTNPNQKVIVRKSQRNIEQGVNWNVFRRDSYTCQYCGKNNVPLTVDHIILWEKMGQSIEENLISACRKCNKTRGNKDFESWLDSDFLKKTMNSGFGKDFDKQYNAVKMLGEAAKAVPLRITSRGR